MGRKKVYAMIASIVAVAAVALLLGFVVVPGSSTSMETATVAATSGSPSEGIAVHGHWTVNVLNADGTLAEHREFENTLAGEGKGLLTDLLARVITTGRWSIELFGTGSNPCKVSSGGADACHICESAYPDSKTSIFKNLTITRVGTTDNAKIILSGTATIAIKTVISSVTTSLEYCDATFSASDCVRSLATIRQYQLTYTVLSPTIAVDIGQQVQVTVEISFS